MQRTLVGPDGGGELDAVAAVDMLLALVIYPGHPELDHALRLHQPRLANHNGNLLRVGTVVRPAVP